MYDITTEKNMKIIVFQLRDEEYGVPVEQVLSIERVQHITRVPKTPVFVKGVINLRGVVTPIIDLRGRFNIEEKEFSDHTRIIIVNVDDMHVGLIVDAANDVIDIPVISIEPPPEIVGGVEADYLHGVAKLEERLLILLNLERVLNADEIKAMQQIEAEVQ